MTYEVKRIEAQDLFTELRNFAYARSPGLRQGFQNGYEEQRAFYHIDPVPPEICDGDHYAVPREMAKSTFSFAAFSTPKIRKKRGFSFTLSAGIERTLDRLTPRQSSLIDDEIKEAYEGFDELEEGVLTEANTVEFDIASYAMREIQVTGRHTLSYRGNEIYAFSNDDILTGHEGVLATIPRVESEDGNPRLFVPHPIPHERLEAVQNLEVNLGFWAIVEPFGETLDFGTSWRSAAAQMRAIMHALETGEVM